MDEQWTIAELVEQAAERIAALPAPKNGQVRAVPDERMIRYYGTIGLLDRPAMRGRTALYGRRHLAQIVAIKRLQVMGRSLAQIQGLWPGLDDTSLARMAGVALAIQRPKGRAARPEFWKRAPEPELAAEPAAAFAGSESAGGPPPVAGDATPADAAASAGDVIVPLPPALVPAPAPVELRIELAPQIVLTLAIPGEVAMSPADVRAIRAAAEPLIAELARRRLSPHPGGETV